MVEGEAVRPAGHLAGGLACGKHSLTVAGDRPALELDAHETPRGMSGIQPGERFAPDEIAFLEFDGPAERAAERVGVIVHVRAIETQPRLQSQRVTCAEAALDQPFRPPRLDERIPEPRGISGVDVELEAVLAGRSEERRVGKECRSRWSP